MRYPKANNSKDGVARVSIPILYRLTALQLADAWMVSKRNTYSYEKFEPPKNAAELSQVVRNILKDYGEDWTYRTDELKGDWEKDRDSLMPLITAWMF